MDAQAYMINAVTTGNLQEVARLLNVGADVNGTDLHGRTPLHYAADCGKRTIAQLLLEAGAKVDLKDNSGMTPLQYACCNGRKDCVRLLLRCGAKTKVKTEAGWTPMHFASAGGHKDCCQLLLDAGFVLEAPVGRKAKEAHVSCILIARTKEVHEMLKENTVVPQKIAARPPSSVYSSEFD